MKRAAFVLAGFVFAPIANAQTSSPGNSLRAWTQNNCVTVGDTGAKSTEQHRTFDQLRATLTPDRSSVTSNIVSIVLKGTPSQEPKHHFLRVWANKVTVQVNESDTSRRRILQQGISDIQSLIDNGGNWSGEYSYEKTTTCGKTARTFLNLHSGIGKLDSPGNDPAGRIAGNLTGEGLLRLDLSEIPNDFAAIVGARVSYVRALRNSLLSNDRINTLAVAQVFASARIYGADAITASFTAISEGKKYNPRVSIVLNMNR